MTVFLTVLVIVLLLVAIFACRLAIKLFVLIMGLLAENSLFLHEERGEQLVSHSQKMNNILNTARDLFYTVPINEEDKK